MCAIKFQLLLVYLDHPTNVSKAILKKQWPQGNALFQNILNSKVYDKYLSVWTLL